MYWSFLVYILIYKYMELNYKWGSAFFAKQTFLIIDNFWRKLLFYYINMAYVIIHRSKNINILNTPYCAIRGQFCLHKCFKLIFKVISLLNVVLIPYLSDLNISFWS